MGRTARRAESRRADSPQDSPQWHRNPAETPDGNNCRHGRPSQSRGDDQPNSQRQQMVFITTAVAIWVASGLLTIAACCARRIQDRQQPQASNSRSPSEHSASPPSTAPVVGGLGLDSRRLPASLPTKPLDAPNQRDYRRPADSRRGAPCARAAPAAAPPDRCDRLSGRRIGSCAVGRRLGLSCR